MENKNIDNLIRESLKSNVEPSEQLNANLKREIRLNASKKTVSLMYFPLVLASIYSVCLSFFVIAFVSNLLLRATLIIAFIIPVISVLCLTLIGVNNYELKKGSVVEI